MSSIKHDFDKKDCNWQETFKLSGVDIDSVDLDVFSVDGYNDGDSWVGLFRIRGGLYVAVSGWCDYTGWGCKDGGDAEEFGTLRDAVFWFQLSDLVRAGLSSLDPAPLLESAVNLDEPEPPAPAPAFATELAGQLWKSWGAK